MKTRVLVYGSRGMDSRYNYILRHIFEEYILSYYEHDELIVVSGMARGADALGVELAKTYDLELHEYPADWNKHGKSAGYIRNALMGDVTDIAICLWDGISRGTSHMTSLLENKGVKVYMYNATDNYHNRLFAGPGLISSYITNYRYEKRLLDHFSDDVFVFGDNMIEKGTAGQACIRYLPNSFGIPTKRVPSMHPSSFFSDKDDEIEAVQQALQKLKEIGERNTIVFPSSRIGSGLARIQDTSPLIFNLIEHELSKIHPLYSMGRSYS